MFGTLNDLTFHQTVGEMSVAVSADTVGREEQAFVVTIKREGFIAVIEADHVGWAKVGRSTDLEPSLGIGLRISSMNSRFGFTNCGCRELALHVIGGIFYLAQNRRNDLSIGFNNATVRRRHVVLHHGMQTRQIVIRHERKHVMLHMVIHVPVEIPMNRIHVDRQAIKPVIEHVFGETGVLRIAINIRQPRA